jgi:hypothetical protein
MKSLQSLESSGTPHPTAQPINPHTRLATPLYKQLVLCTAECDVANPKYIRDFEFTAALYKISEKFPSALRFLYRSVTSFFNISQPKQKFPFWRM